MAQSKEFFTRIQHKHDTDANWNKAVNFIPMQGEIIVYDKDSTHNYARVKIGDGVTKINNLPFTVTDASETVPGIAKLYPASSCKTFTSDDGALTPAAAKKAVDTFAITKAAGGTLTNSSSSQKNEPSIGWKTIGANTPYIGFAKDQTDGTFVWSLRGTSYQSGLAIGGGSGNLLWKGNRVIDANNISEYANKYTHPSYPARTGKPTANQTPAFGGTVTVSQITSDATGHVTGATDRIITIPSSTATTSAAGLMSAADKTKLDGIATGANNYTYTLPNATSSVLGGVKIGRNISVSSGTISLSKANVTAALGYTPPTTDTTYSVATTSANGLMSSTDKTNLNTAVTHVSNTSNPHSVTKSQVGLGNVTNNRQMPIAGGTFTGNAIAYSTNRNSTCLRNIVVQNKSGTAQSTNYIIMKRK